MANRPHPAFQATRWSLVSRAASPAEPAARAALEELCQLYWEPLRAFAERFGLSPSDSEDATQAFLADFARKERFAAADANRGRLRAYLCSSFSNHLCDLRRRQRALIRGGGQVHLSLDDGREIDPPDPFDPEQAFARSWALATMDAAVARLETTLAASGKSITLDPYRGFLGLETSGKEDYLATAKELGVSEGAVRVTVCRLRKQFREALFATVADTLDEPTEESVRSEIRALIAALAE